MLMQLDDRGVDQPIGQENVGQLVTMDTGNILYSWYIQCIDILPNDKNLYWS